MPEDTLTLAAPSGLTAEIDGRDVLLRWSPVGGAQAYEVHEMLKKPEETVKERVTGTSSRRRNLRGGRYRYGIRAVGGDAVSAMSELVDVTLPVENGGQEPENPPVGVGSPPPPPGAVPADRIDLTRWYLTLPVPRGGSGDDARKARNVYQSDPREGGLLRFSSEHFRVRDGAVEYVAPVEGATTSSASGSTRSELREMTGPTRNDKAEWTLGTGIHTLTCTLTCDPTSISGTGTGAHRPRRECIVGQIHSEADEPPLYLAVKMPDASSSSGVLELFLDHAGSNKLLEGLGPRTRFTYRIEATSETCTVWAAVGDDWRADTSPTEIPVSRFRSRDKCYFKAGAYNKTKISDPGAAPRNTGRSVVRHFLLEVG